MNIVSFVLILIVVLVLTLLLAKLLTKVVENTSLGWLNRLMGLVLSLAVTALVLGIFAMAFDALNERFQIISDTKIISGSTVYSMLKDFADFVFPYLKQIFAPAAEVISGM